MALRPPGTGETRQSLAVRGVGAVSQARGAALQAGLRRSARGKPGGRRAAPGTRRLPGRRARSRRHPGEGARRRIEEGWYPCTARAIAWSHAFISGRWMTMASAGTRARAWRERRSRDSRGPTPVVVEGSGAAPSSGGSLACFRSPAEMYTSAPTSAAKNTVPRRKIHHRGRGPSGRCCRKRPSLHAAAATSRSPAASPSPRASSGRWRSARERRASCPSAWG